MQYQTEFNKFVNFIKESFAYRDLIDPKSSPSLKGQCIRNILVSTNDYFRNYKLNTQSGKTIYPITYIDTRYFNVAKERTFRNNDHDDRRKSAIEPLTVNVHTWTQDAHAFNIAIVVDDFLKNLIVTCLKYLTNIIVKNIHEKMQLTIDILALSNNFKIISLTITDITSPFCFYLNFHSNKNHNYTYVSNHYTLLLQNIIKKDNRYLPKDPNWFTDQCVNLTTADNYQKQLKRLEDRFDALIKRLLSEKYTKPNTSELNLEKRAVIRQSDDNPYFNDIGIIRMPLLDSEHVQRLYPDRYNADKILKFKTISLNDLYATDPEFKQFIRQLI